MIFIKNIQPPQPYPHCQRKLPTISDAGWDKVDDFTLRKYVDYMPQLGIQEKALHCESNVIFLCGESQMGKTFLTLLALLKGIGKPNYTGRFVSFRQKDNQKGTSILRDAMTILGSFGNCEVSTSDDATFYWSQWNNSIQFIGSNYNIRNPQERTAFEEMAKKHQASRFVFDEATGMAEFEMASYWWSRNRDDSGETPQSLYTFNPKYGHWTTEMLTDAGYIGSDYYFKPEMDGVTRYFYNAGNSPSEIIWGNTPEEVAERAGIEITEKERRAGITIHQIVKSFTAFTGESADNLKLISATKGQNIGNLHNTGKTQRAVLKKGYFGPVEQTERNVSRTMIHQLWENPIGDDETMYATMDISSGKAENDKCPMIIWRGLQMIAIELFSGEPSTLQAWIGNRLSRYGVKVENFAFDGTGHGYWVRAFTNGIPITWNKRPIQEYDSNGNVANVDAYFDLRSQLMGKTEVLIKQGLITCSIDKDTLVPYGHKNEKRRFFDILSDELELFQQTTVNGKIKYISTEDFKKRYRFSPDITTTIVMRAVFELDARPRKKPKPIVTDNAYDALYQRPPMARYNPYSVHSSQYYKHTQRWR